MKERKYVSRQNREGRVILIRHGHTAWNKKRYLGWEDIPLDWFGKKQGQYIADRLMGERVDAIFSSPLNRAMETIKPLAEKLGMPVETSANLKEIHFGQWQGRLKTEHKIRVKKDHQYLPIPGGESLFDVYQRAKQFTEKLKMDIPADSHLVIVGHFRVIQMIRGIIFQLSFSSIINQLDFKPGTGSLFEIRYRLNSENDAQILSHGFLDLNSYNYER